MIYDKDELYNVLQYPRPRVTVDMVIHQMGRILIQKRNIEPFKDMWCLPGGHVEVNEDISTAALREIKEEMGLHIPKSKWNMFKVYNDDKADPRGWRITFGMTASLDGLIDTEITVDGEECTDYQFEYMSDIPDLAFNHNEIILDCYNFLHQKC